MATYLDRILARHREVAAADSRSIEALIEQAMHCGPIRSFADALAPQEHLAVIGEIKRRSPSKGVLLENLDPGLFARTYAEAGAACLSVLTDIEFFGGGPSDLRDARAACALPVLRKDFTVCAHDVADTRLMGADCVLLIAAALSQNELTELHDLAVQIGLDVLVEIHDEQELERALDAGAFIVGVNQRDLVTFEVDHARAVRMGSIIPDSVVKVAESGVRGPSDAAALAAAGYQAVLVGETLVTAGDPGAMLKSLRVAR